MSAPTYKAYDGVETSDMPDPQPTPVWQYQGPPQYPMAQVPGHYYQPAVAPPQAGPESHPPAEFQPLVEAPREQRPPRDFLIPSVLSCVFCNLWCGSMALAASLLSRGAKRRNQIDEARRRGRHACIFSIIGLVLTLCFVTVGLVMTFVVLN